MEPSRPASSCGTQAVTWAAWYDAWLLIILTPKAQSFLFFFFSTQAVSQFCLRYVCCASGACQQR